MPRTCANWNAESLAEKGVDHAALVVQADADYDANTAASRALVGAFAAEIREAAKR